MRTLIQCNLCIIKDQQKRRQSPAILQGISKKNWKNEKNLQPKKTVTLFTVESVRTTKIAVQCFNCNLFNNFRRGAICQIFGVNAQVTSKYRSQLSLYAITVY